MPGAQKSTRRAHLPRLAWAAACAVAAACALGAATYAWFTSNRLVEGDTVSVRSGTQTLELGISGSVGGPFTEQAAVTQISTGKTLQPVSTADLTRFYCDTVAEGELAVKFALTERGYYHGQVFLQATATGQPDGAQVALYFDEGGEQGGVMVNAAGDAAGLMRNAARVGLVFTGAAQGAGGAGNALIFQLSAEHNGGSGTGGNTALGGVRPSGDVVLGGEPPAYVPDPAVLPEAYSLTDSTLPEAPLALLPLNTVVTVDLYYYLEGCDTDCTKAIQQTEMSVQLPFYGVLTEAGED